MTIPQVRERLLALSIEHDLPELAALAEQTRRRHAGRKAPVASVALTPELAGRIRAYARKHPAETMVSIGVRFGVNQGRVSEALFGKR